MRKTSFLVFGVLMAVLGGFSCRPEPIFEASTSLELQFRAFYGDELLLMGNTSGYPFEDTLALQFTNVGFYISEVKLLSGEGNDETNLIAQEWVDFSQTYDALEAEQGQVFSLRRIATGNYKSIRFNIGIAAEENATLPEEYFEGHPLSNEDRYRTVWNSYIFSLIEGRADTDGDNDFLDLAFLYRSATDAQLQTITIPLDLVLVEEKTGRLTFAVDIGQVIGGSTSVPIVADQGGDPATQLALGRILAENFASAITLEK